MYSCNIKSDIPGIFYIQNIGEGRIAKSSVLSLILSFIPKNGLTYPFCPSVVQEKS